MIDYDFAISLNLKFAEAFNNRGIAKLATGDIDGAIADYTVAIHLKHPNLHWVFANRGRAYLAKNNSVNALVDSTASIDIDPTYAIPYHTRAMASINQTDFILAHSDLLKYLELGGGDYFGDRSEVENILKQIEFGLNAN